MAIKQILQLGNPQLYDISQAVTETECSLLSSVVTDLHDTMMAFRAQYQAGRAIAAPQIGVMKRLIYMHITKPVAMFNPVITPTSDEKMIVWDDCMCFPELLVKVERFRYCQIDYRDEDWRPGSLLLADDLAELLQHEVDHLDGILAVSKALDAQSFALRSQRQLLNQQVT